MNLYSRAIKTIQTDPYTTFWTGTAIITTITTISYWFGVKLII